MAKVAPSVVRALEWLVHIEVYVTHLPTHPSLMLLARPHLPKIPQPPKTVPPAGAQVFKHVSL